MEARYAPPVAGNRRQFSILRTTGATIVFFFFSSRRRHTRSLRDCSSDVCSSDLFPAAVKENKSTGSIPRVDLFSFTAAGKPFVLQNWLAELLYYIVYRAAGFPLLMFFNALMATAAFLFVYRLCLEATDKVRIAAFVAFLAAIGSYCTLRPQTFSFFMFAAYSWALSGYRFRRRDALWTLPVLMIFWVNLHGAFVLGLGLVAIYAATEGCRRFIDPQRTDALTAAELRKLLLVL